MRRCCERGFTLLEVLAALLIAAVAITYLLQSETASVRISNAARDLRDATLRAQLKIREVAAGIEVDLSGTFEDRPSWSWEATREPIPEPEAFGLSKVVVTVSYPAGGETRVVALEQIVE